MFRAIKVLKIEGNSGNKRATKNGLPKLYKSAPKIHIVLSFIAQENNKIPKSIYLWHSSKIQG